LNAKIIPNYEYKEMLKGGFIKVKAGKLVNTYTTNKQGKSNKKTHMVDVNDYIRYLKYKCPNMPEEWYNMIAGVK
jgi:hypothetical protein